MTSDANTSSASALRGMGALFAARALVGLSSLVVFAVLARILTADDFGLFALAYSVSYLFAAVLEGGHGLLIVRELAQRPAQAATYVSALVSLRLIAGGPLLLLAVGGAMASTDSPLTLFLVLALTAHLQVFAGLPREVLIAREHPTLAALHSIVETLLRTAALVGAAAAFQSVLAAFAAAAVAHGLWAAVGLLTLWRAAALDGFGSGARQWRAILRLSLPYGLFVVLSAAHAQLDVLVVSVLLPLSAVGIFQAAMRIVAATDYLAEAAWRWSYPRFSRAALADVARLGTEVTILSRGLVLVGIGLAAAIILAAPLFIPALYGSKLETAVLPLQVLALAIPLRFAAHAYGAGLSAAGLQRHRSTILLGVISVSVPLQLVLVSAFGVIGAAAGITISSALLVATYIAAARRMPRLHLGPAPALGACAFALGAGGILSAGVRF